MKNVDILGMLYSISYDLKNPNLDGQTCFYSKNILLKRLSRKKEKLTQEEINERMKSVFRHDKHTYKDVEYFDYFSIYESCMISKEIK